MSLEDKWPSQKDRCHNDLKKKIPSMRVSKLNMRPMDKDESLEDQVDEFIRTFRKLQELQITDTIKETFDVLPGSFQIKIYSYTTSSRSELTKLIDVLAGTTSAEKQTISYMILLYREIRPDPDPECPQIEMYALTSGNAHTMLSENEYDEEFPKQIARRVLEFNFRSLSSKHLIGTHTSSSAIFRSNEVTELSFWDYLGHITTNFKVPFKTNCSLFRVGGFQTKKGNPRKVSMTVGINYLRVHMSLSLVDLAYMIKQLSRISRGIIFKRFGSTEEEDDDNKFDILGHVELVKKKTIIEERDNQLRKDIIASIKNNDPLKISLVHRKLEAWNNANKFALLIKEDGRKKRECLQTWEDVPPCFSDIAEEVRKRFPGNSLQKGNLDQLFIQFEDTSNNSKEKPDSLLQFVERHVRTEDGKNFFRYCGKWLQIRTAYLSQLEVEFTRIERGCQLDILPLPWIYSGKNAAKDIKRDKTERMRPTTVMAPLTFEKWLLAFQLKDNFAFSTSLQVNFDNFPKENTEALECAKEVFYRMHCHQTEGMYNEGFLWYDQLVATLKTPKPQYLLSDRILVKHVELFDILCFTPEKTYLIHVKEGFAETTRDICSQIRISADLLFKNSICNNPFDFLEGLWNRVTSGQKKGYEAAVKQRYERLGKDNFMELFKRDELVYVLAYRDHREDENAAQFDNYPKGRLRAAFKEKYNMVKKELLKRGYLKVFAGKTRLTDKIYCTQEQAKKEIELYPVSDRLKAFKILQKAMSIHKSYIAKIEIVHLYNHFKQLQTTSQRMTLKLCRIPTKLDV